VGRRGRRRAAQDGAETDTLKAPTSDYTDAEGNVLTLRGSLTAATRAQYARTLAGNRLSQEDAWQRAMELLFERLVTRWTIAGAPLEGQRELLARYRAATQAERSWIRGVIRAHCAESFPDVQAP
jgi:hypothetical protein